MATRVTDQLVAEEGRIRCNRCETEICAAEENYKLWSLQEVVSIEDVPGGGNPAPFEMGEHLELRRFYCPGCTRQLGVEVARPGAAPLFDIELRT